MLERERDRATTDRADRIERVERERAERAADRDRADSRFAALVLGCAIVAAGAIVAAVSARTNK